MQMAHYIFIIIIIIIIVIIIIIIIIVIIIINVVNGKLSRRFTMVWTVVRCSSREMHCLLL